MRKFLAAVLACVVMMLGVASMSSAGEFATYLDYLNSDSIDSHPGVVAQIGVNETFSLGAGFLANRSEVYELNFGPTLYSNDLYGRLFFNEDFDPALRIGVNVDIAESIFGEVGYEWMYERNEWDFTAVDSGKVILSLGLRWGGPGTVQVAEGSGF